MKGLTKAYSCIMIAICIYFYDLKDHLNISFTKTDFINYFNIFFKLQNQRQAILSKEQCIIIIKIYLM